LKTKKAQGLSLNMIVVGAIGLVVLVVIIAIFVSSAQKSQKDIDAKQKGLDCDKVATGGYFATITLRTECAKANGEIMIGKYFGIPKTLQEIKIGGEGTGQFSFQNTGSSIVYTDGMGYVCCKYKQPIIIN